ncbi:hypothetical protein F511_02046 [Dorcoceras hygrometricum]|uniref:Uncharacterized protein n=1 Tax=Dorcoceras hygrometricum TaxID=472368 RepID=A0A2Z7BY71_9LAMI|nr:hypothetical protein F511_02046 [Dorcoceras hygrometricum]
MATSLESQSPASLNKGSPGLIGSSSSPPLFSPSSDKRFWSTLRTRIDTLLENRRSAQLSLPTQVNSEATDHSKRTKEDSMLLLRGFDSVAQTLSQLSSNIDNALQGARDLARPPTLTEMVHATLEKAKSQETLSEENFNKEEMENDEEQRGLKRKLEESQVSAGEDSHHYCKEKGENLKELEKIKKAKNMAISMATKASALARELRTLKSDLSFMQERCVLLEEENRKLRNGFAKEIRPDEDDLVRLQLEALLAEKSRLANENANLTRENQCLHQLVEYHQLTSQDLSASYENVCRGMCLDFSSPAETDEADRYQNTPPKTPDAEFLGYSKSLNESFDDENE